MKRISNNSIEILRASLAYHLTSRRQKAVGAVVWGAFLLPFFVLGHFVLLKKLDRFYAGRNPTAPEAQGP